METTPNSRNYWGPPKIRMFLVLSSEVFKKHGHADKWKKKQTKDQQTDKQYRLRCTMQYIWIINQILIPSKI